MQKVFMTASHIATKFTLRFPSSPKGVFCKKKCLNPVRSWYRFDNASFFICHLDISKTDYVPSMGIIFFRRQ